MTDSPSLFSTFDIFSYYLQGGLIDGGGPMKVITNPGCYEFEDGEMILTSLHPHCTLEQVRDRTGRAVRVYSRLETTAPPTPREPRILRDELDPARLYTGGLQVGT